jgi:hypothetical protein
VLGKWEAGMPPTDLLIDGEIHYFALCGFEQKREHEIIPLAGPYLAITDRYGCLISSIALLLGRIPPTGSRDIIIRDLMADVFDFLYEGRLVVLKGKSEVAYPLIRRAFESLSLMVACSHSSDLADRWCAGKEIKNYHVRKVLSAHPMGEGEDALKSAYAFFSNSTHPNRDIIAHRHLGRGNGFTLGCIGRPSLFLTAEYCLQSLRLWFWLGAFLSFEYRAHLEKDEFYFDHYMKAAKEAESVAQWLVEQRDRVLAQEQEMQKNEPNP